MPPAPRKHLLVNAARATALAGVLTVAYVASYPPGVHLLSIKATADPPGWNPDGWWIMYAPAELLFDKTPLDGPILAWAGVCGTRSTVVTASLHRAQNQCGPPR